MSIGRLLINLQTMVDSPGDISMGLAQKTIAEALLILMRAHEARVDERSEP